MLIPRSVADCEHSHDGAIDVAKYINVAKNLKFFQGDDIADEVTMKFGMDLYEEYKDDLDSLSYTVILNGLEAMESVGTSRLLHKCLDTSSTGITVI